MSSVKTKGGGAGATDADPANYVLDSFALLAFLQAEPGGPAVRDILRDAERHRAEITMSVINLGEVLYLTGRRCGAEVAGAAMAAIEQLPIRIVDADLAETMRAARVKASHPLSLADAFAVALARELGATIVTGNPELEAIAELVSIHWIGSRA